MAKNLAQTNGNIDTRLGGEGVRAAARHLFPGDSQMGVHRPVLDPIDIRDAQTTPHHASTTEAPPADEASTLTTHQAPANTVITTDRGTISSEELRAAMDATSRQAMPDPVLGDDDEGSLADQDGLGADDGDNEGDGSSDDDEGLSSADAAILTAAGLPTPSVGVPSGDGGTSGREQPSGLPPQ